MREKQTHIFHSISWFCNFTPEEKKSPGYPSKRSVFDFFFLRFLFFFFFPMHTGYPSGKISWHEVRFSPVYIAARCNGTLGSRIAFVICTDEILRDSRNAKPFAPISQKKESKKKNGDPSTVKAFRGSVAKPTKSRINRETRNLNSTAFTLTVN